MLEVILDIKPDISLLAHKLPGIRRSLDRGQRDDWLLCQGQHGLSLTLTLTLSCSLLLFTHPKRVHFLSLPLCLVRLVLLFPEMEQVDALGEAGKDVRGVDLG